MAVDSQMLEELRKIREALTPKPEPPAPKGLWAEFKDFLGKAGVLGLGLASLWAPTLARLFQRSFRTSSCQF